MTDKKPKPKKECANCGDEFEPQRTTSRFCSKECALADAMINNINETVRHQHQIEEALL